MIETCFGDTLLQKMQTADPEKWAHVDAKGIKTSYAELLALTEKYIRAINNLNLNDNDNIICLLPIGPDLLSCLMASFKMFKTIVFIDPRLGLSNFFKITKNLKTTTVVYKKKSILVFVLKLVFNNLTFKKIDFDSANSHLKWVQNEWLIDGFTSGTTGETKRIRRSHKHMLLSAKIFSEHIIPIKKDHHLIGYTLSALRNIIDHGTAFEPPQKKHLYYQFIESNFISRISGPPSIAFAAAMAYKKMNKKNSKILNIVMGGAPVQKWLLLLLKDVFPLALIQNIYGCTECEPISHTSAENILSYNGLGYFVGAPVKELKCNYVELNNEIFELIVYGEHVTKNEGHITGDLVRKTSDNNLVLVGRKRFILTNVLGLFYGQYEIETLIENSFTEVKKSAVLQKNNILTVYIELFFDQKKPQIENLMQILRPFNFTEIKIIFKNQLPYDKRHQWKVQYHKL